MTGNGSPPRRTAIVHVGPSISIDQARQLLPGAQFRPPVRRGDLRHLGSGVVVGIIDGVFDQEFSVAPAEIRHAIARGVTIFGSSSMGALRAAEVEGVVGVGRVFQMYRDELIDRDDEVALIFDSDSHRALTEPLVNIRYSVDRLFHTGTISGEIRATILETAIRLHYRDRTYPNILRQAGLSERSDCARLLELLRSFDLKREDAQLLLERLGAYLSERPDLTAAAVDTQELAGEQRDELSDIEAAEHEEARAPLMVWEYGERLGFDELVRFLKMTGRFSAVARNAVTRFLFEGNALPEVDLTRVPSAALRSPPSWTALDGRAAAELGVREEELARHLEAERLVVQTVAALTLEDSDELNKAVRAELWMNNLGLKREALRLGSVKLLASLGRARRGAPSSEERRAVQQLLVALHGASSWPRTAEALRGLGLSNSEIRAFVEDLAQARWFSADIVRCLDGLPARAKHRRRPYRQPREMRLRASPRARGDPRFCLPMAAAERITRRLARAVKVTRVGMIGELDTLGVHIAQAFRSSSWSTTIGSGKSTTRAGARVGSVMEEVEKYCQDVYESPSEMADTFARLRRARPAVDPRSLGLPYDTCYREDLRIGWTRCFDLLGSRWVMVPTAVLVSRRFHNDILYSERLGTKVFSTNGLASGFTLEEAILHGLCEYVERHAERLSELQISNPGGVGEHTFRFVALSSAPRSVTALVDKFRAAGLETRVLDITSEVGIPTFEAQLFFDPFDGGEGFFQGRAAHPNPEVAIRMALLEAAQTKIGNIAGSREDLTVNARSLGRHERASPLLDDMLRFWYGSDPREKPFSSLRGFYSADARDDLYWCMDRVRDAGFDTVLVADYSQAPLAPARAVRVMVPGMETTNPLDTGLRARITAIRDLLPRPRPLSGRGTSSRTGYRMRSARRASRPR